MLSGKLVRVRIVKNKIIPLFIETNGPPYPEIAAQLLTIFRQALGATREELEEEVREVVGDQPSQLVEQGLAKLLFDRCDFGVDSQFVPEEVREKIFLAAADARKALPNFDRDAVIRQIAEEINVPADLVEAGLFADLKAEQRIMSFEDVDAKSLLERYNVALVQSILMRAQQVQLIVTGEAPARFRKLCQAIKFHRLIAHFQPAGSNAVSITLDGPMSLFQSTSKYGLQLANCLGHVLQCKDFELTATIRWGAQRKEKIVAISSRNGLKTHLVDYGQYIPQEVAAFAETFRKKERGWVLRDQVAILNAGKRFWIPDYTLEHPKTKRIVHLELAGFWRRTATVEWIAQLKEHLREPFLIAVGDSMNTDESEEDVTTGHVYRYRRTPVVDEVIRLAESLTSSD